MRRDVPGKNANRRTPRFLNNGIDPEFLARFRNVDHVAASQTPREHGNSFDSIQTVSDRSGVDLLRGERRVTILIFFKMNPKMSNHFSPTSDIHGILAKPAPKYSANTWIIAWT